MAKKTIAQKLETLVARTMKNGRGHRLHDYIRKDYGTVPDLAHEIWSGYRAGDVSTRTMFHLRGKTNDPSAFDLDDLIGLANAIVEEFPEGFVSEPRARYMIWTDAPGQCGPTKDMLTKKLEAEPELVGEVMDRLDEFVEPARSAALHTLSLLGHTDASSDEDALSFEAIKTLNDTFWSATKPPAVSHWSDDEWLDALANAALSDEVSCLHSFECALALIPRWDLPDLARALALKMTRHTYKTFSLVEAAAARGPELLPLLEEQLVDVPEELWVQRDYRSPHAAVACLTALTLYRAHEVSIPERVLPTFERFVSSYTFNFTISRDHVRRHYAARVHELWRTLPHDLVERATTRPDAFEWDHVAVIPSARAAERAARELERMDGDWLVLNTHTSIAACDAFALLGEFTGPALDPLTLSEDRATRNRATRALGECAHPASAEPLARALHDSSKKTRALAIEGLSRFDADDVVHVLEGVLSEGKKDARVAAATILAALSPHPGAHAVAKAHLASKERTAEVLSFLKTVRKK